MRICRKDNVNGDFCCGVHSTLRWLYELVSMNINKKFQVREKGRSSLESGRPLSGSRPSSSLSSIRALSTEAAIAEKNRQEICPIPRFRRLILTIDPSVRAQICHSKLDLVLHLVSTGRLVNTKQFGVRRFTAWLRLSSSAFAQRERDSVGANVYGEKLSWEKAYKQCTRARFCGSWVNFD